MGPVKAIIWANYIQSFVAISGIVIAVYSLLVEIHMEANPKYEPMCDFSSYISCSKALNSQWGKGLGLVGPIFGDSHWLNQRNPVYGILLYSVFLLLGVMNSTKLTTLYIGLAWLANLTSVYLAYILFFKLNAVCVVCLGTYLVNALLLLLGYWRRKLLRDIYQKKRR